MKMKQPDHHDDASTHVRRPQVRLGLTTAELIVAAILLAATVSVVATGAANMKRVQRQGDHYRAAVDYLSNVLTESEFISDDQLDEYLATLEIPEDLQLKLGAAARIEGRVQADSRGNQILLELHLDHGPDEHPLQLAGFRYGSQPTQEQSSSIHSSPAEIPADWDENAAGDDEAEAPVSQDVDALSEQGTEAAQ